VEILISDRLLVVAVGDAALGGKFEAAVAELGFETGCLGGIGGAIDERSDYDGGETRDGG
jgi:hypothetical protein